MADWLAQASQTEAWFQHADKVSNLEYKLNQLAGKMNILQNSVSWIVGPAVHGAHIRLNALDAFCMRIEQFQLALEDRCSSMEQDLKNLRQTLREGELIQKNEAEWQRNKHTQALNDFITLANWRWDATVEKLAKLVTLEDNWAERFGNADGDPPKNLTTSSGDKQWCKLTMSSTKKAGTKDFEGPEEANSVKNLADLRGNTKKFEGHADARSGLTDGDLRRRRGCR